ncbi:MAG: DUF4149 domain-containing protein [Gammaproteobacteria bacterium]|nr:MAG: DUF4149 domain-containing protein [Gammaproteobacteria bacterium]
MKTRPIFERLPGVFSDVLIVAWIGSLWTIGYLVVPILFQMLDKKLAGQLAGQMFVVEYWMGCASAVLLIILERSLNSEIPLRFWIASVGLFILDLVQLFVIHPMIVAVKQEIAQGADLNSRFATLHAIGSILYLLMSLLGLMLVLTHFRSLDSEGVKGHG